MSRTVRLLVIVVAGIFMLAGCGGGAAKKMTETPIQDIAPDWVIKGSGAYGGERGRVFYGVGVAKGGQDVVRSREKADARARAEAARSLEIYVASLTEDYVESIEDEDKSTSQGLFERVIKQVTNMTLNGLEMVEHWQNPETGDLYALARVDLSMFENIADKAKIDEKVKDYIRNNAERMHEKLANEVEKQEAAK